MSFYNLNNIRKKNTFVLEFGDINKGPDPPPQKE